MKKSFVLYPDMKEVLLSLPDGDLRLMVRAIFEYNETGAEPEFAGLLLALWQVFRAQFDRDASKYQKVCDKNRENVRRRWNKSPLPDTTVYDRIRPHTTDTKPYHPIPPDTKNTDNDNDIKEKYPYGIPKEKGFSFDPPPEETKSFKQWTEQEFRADIAKYAKAPEVGQAFGDYWTERSASGKMRFQLEKTWQTDRRLATWERNNAQWGQKKRGPGTTGKDYSGI